VALVAEINPTEPCWMLFAREIHALAKTGLAVTLLDIVAWDHKAGVG
jgi:hypothetical protein